MKNTYVITFCHYDSWDNSFERFVHRVLVNVDEDSIKEYKCYGYEIYIVDTDGTVDIIQKYNDYRDPECPEDEYED